MTVEALWCILASWQPHMEDSTITTDAAESKELKYVNHRILFLDNLCCLLFLPSVHYHSPALQSMLICVESLFPSVHC